MATVRKKIVQNQRTRKSSDIQELYTIPEERISYPPTGSTTISLGLSRFSQIRTVLMVPSVLETSIRSVPTKVKRENNSNQVGIARAMAKTPPHNDAFFPYIHLCS